MVHPKKHLGQHFLTDPSIAERIVGSLEMNSGKTIMEIGPGKGILTQILLREHKGKLIPVEIDSEAVDYITREWPELEGKVLLQDFLKLDILSLGEKKIHLIGNFPYNISSQIFFRVLEHRDIFDEVVCMIQKEVAQRVASPPGSREYGILSVFLQAFYSIEYLFTVKAGSFFPPPRVQSGVIRLRRNQTAKLDCDEKLFFQVVKTGFNQRRKTLRNSLKTILQQWDLQDEILSKRPEQLGVSEFVYLTNLIGDRIKQ